MKFYNQIGMIRKRSTYCHESLINIRQTTEHEVIVGQWVMNDVKYAFYQQMINEWCDTCSIIS